MLRCVVTGGAGFVGSHLCERLVDEGHDVVCIDDLSTGYVRNLDAVIQHPRFHFLEHDVTEPYFVPADRIYNLACPASPVHYQRDPIRTVLTNVQGTLNALRLAARTGARVLQASTSEVYGDPDVHPQVEDYHGNVNPTGPRACYDEGKRCAETLCFDYHRQHGVQVRVVRIFNTYGPRMAPDDGRVVSNFVNQALGGKPLSVYGSGEQTRSFCYVSDLVDGLCAAMHEDEAVGPLNLGNPGEVTMLQLAEMIIGLTESDSDVEKHPLPVDDPRRRRPDITRAREVLGFSPKVPLDDGLRETINYFRTRDQNGSEVARRGGGEA